MSRHNDSLFGDIRHSNGSTVRRPSAAWGILDACHPGTQALMLVNHKRLLVEWGHCDPARIVFYPQYLAWFDDCTSALFAAAGLPISALFKSHGVVGVPLVDVKVHFLIPSTFGDELVAESTVAEFRRSSFVVRHRLFKAGALAVEGFETRVWTARDPGNPERLESRPLPDEVIERLSAAGPDRAQDGTGQGRAENGT